MLRIYGRRTSVNVHKALWMCAEAGVPFELVSWGGEFGGSGDPAFLALNPNGLVPTLVDGDVVLWESNTIVRYVAECYAGDPWWPDDRARRYQANQWMDWGLSMLTPTIRVAYIGLVQTPAQRRERVPVHRPYEFHPRAVAAALAHTARLWGRLDAWLAERPFVAGDRPSMGDIPLAVWANRWYRMPIERPRLAGVEAWMDRFKERPAFRAEVLDAPL